MNRVVAPVSVPRHGTLGGIWRNHLRFAVYRNDSTDSPRISKGRLADQPDYQGTGFDAVLVRAGCDQQLRRKNPTAEPDSLQRLLRTAGCNMVRVRVASRERSHSPEVPEQVLRFGCVSSEDSSRSQGIRVFSVFLLSPELCLLTQGSL